MDCEGLSATLAGLDDLWERHLQRSGHERPPSLRGIDPVAWEPPAGSANPYLDHFNRIGGWCHLMNPEMLEMAATRQRGSFEVRWLLCQKYAFAVPDEEVLRLIKEFSPRGVVELGAGSGYWAAMLRRIGVRVAAYDLDIAGRAAWREARRAYEEEPKSTLVPPEVCPRPWTRVLRGGVEAVARHPKKTLLLCWPPLAEPMAFDALAAYRAAGGERLVYVGEMGGATADDRFHAELRRYRQVGWYPIPHWESVHDAAYFYDITQPAGDEDDEELLAALLARLGASLPG